MFCVSKYIKKVGYLKCCVVTSRILYSEFVYLKKKKEKKIVIDDDTDKPFSVANKTKTKYAEVSGVTMSGKA